MRWLVVVACACSAKPAPKHRDDAAPVGHHVDAQLALPDATTIAENNPNWKIWGCDAAIEALARFTFSKWEGLPPCRLSDLSMNRSAGLDRELGTAHRRCSTERAVDLALGRGSEITFTLDTLDVVRADFDTTNSDFEATTKADDAVEVLGPPEAKLPYSLWGFTHATGQ
jgi:hypothetical protein